MSVLYHQLRQEKAVKKKKKKELQMWWWKAGARDGMEMDSNWGSFHLVIQQITGSFKSDSGRGIPLDNGKVQTTGRSANCASY